MARRKQAAAATVPQMPEELRRRPLTPEAIAFWVGEDTMPDYWTGDAVRSWAQVHAYSKWSRARRDWQAEHDPTYWHYWRRRGLSPVEIRAKLGFGSRLGEVGIDRPARTAA